MSIIKTAKKELDAQQFSEEIEAIIRQARIVVRGFLVLNHDFFSKALSERGINGYDEQDINTALLKILENKRGEEVGLGLVTNGEYIALCIREIKDKKGSCQL